jgi:uncharacterized protein (TIGR03437 family)
MRILFWLALAVLGSLQGQPLRYTLLPSGTVAPGARLDGTIVHDAASRQIFLFGGQESGAKNDLWVYALDRREWRELRPSGALPPARWGHTLVFDAARRRLLLFGGQASGFFNDLWAYEIDRGAWTRLGSADEGPSRRYGHSAIYEPGRDRLIVSHGFTNSGRFDDTWAFEFGTGRWRDISPASNRPVRRCLHHAVYDAVRGEMLLYGGCASGFGPCPLGDLWSFDLATGRWSERVATPAPSPRQHYGRSFDTARSRMLLFGGSGRGSLNDTWEFDPVSRRWSEAPVEGPAPGARSRHESAYGEGVTYFFGGFKAEGQTNELWALGPAAATGVRAVVNAFDGSDGAVVPGSLVSIYGAGLGGEVRWNGLASTLLFASPEQINAQVPLGLTGQSTAQLTVGTFAAIPVAVAATRLGLYPGAWNQDGRRNAADAPAAAGEIVILFATGHGMAAGATATVAGVAAEVLYADAAPGIFGVMQINLRIPPWTEAGSALPVRVTVNGSEAMGSVSVYRQSLQATTPR